MKELVRGMMILTFVVLTINVLAFEDTPDNRAKLADRFIRNFPFQDFSASLQRKLDKMPEEKRNNALSVLQHVNWDAVVAAIRRAIIEIFSADEIQVLTDAYTDPAKRSILRKQWSDLSADESGAILSFFSTPLGQSILRKWPTYNSKIQAILSNELNAAAKAVVNERRRAKGGR